MKEKPPDVRSGTAKATLFRDFIQRRLSSFSHSSSSPIHQHPPSPISKPLSHIHPLPFPSYLLRLSCIAICVCQKKIRNSGNTGRTLSSSAACRMGKLSVILYITVAIGVLFLVSYTPYDGGHPHHRSPLSHGHRRLKLRSSFTFLSASRRGGGASRSAEDHDHHEPIHFDPIVADMEMHREDKEWEKMYFQEHHNEYAHSAEAEDHELQTEWEDSMNAEDYLNDEEKFNVTNRLIMLFPKIDIDPLDGYVSEKELTAWNLGQASREVRHRTRREMEIHDKNRDGFVSFLEYDPPSWVKSSDGNSFGYDMGWWKEEHFNASDMNDDGLLNVSEFNDFLHPADTKNPKLIQWLCKEEISERDTDKDGKVNFNEFFHGLFDLVRNYNDDDHNSSHYSEDSGEAHARMLFSQLDKDGDRFLIDTELLPVIGQIHPSEHYYAKQQADYIISQADTDKDGRLSLQEMVDNPYVFYTAIFSDDEDYSDHDELR